MESMVGKTVLLTGATLGIGRAAAFELARKGATLVLVGRDAGRTASTVAEVKEKTGNARVEGLVADLSSQASVRALAEQFRARHRRLDVLVNNAGAIFTQRQISTDGLEMTFALNHLGYFLLTSLLLDLLKASAPSRIVNVSSDAHRQGRIDFDDLQGARRYSGWSAYGQSKLANILFTFELARRLEGTKVTVNCLHPGFVRSGFGRNTPGLFKRLIELSTLIAKTPEQGAQTIVYLATSPEVEGVSGRYFANCREKRPRRTAFDVGVARRLWELSEQLTGLAPKGAAAAG